MTFTEFLDRIPKLNLAISAAALALSKTILRKSLVPDNLDLFGGSWYLAATCYTCCFLAFLFTVISVAGVFELDAAEARKQETRLAPG